MASGLSACQAQLTTVLKKLEDTNEKLANLTQRIECLEEQVAKQAEGDHEGNNACVKGKRKRPKNTLTVQVSHIILILRYIFVR